MQTIRRHRQVPVSASSPEWSKRIKGGNCRTRRDPHPARRKPIEAGPLARMEFGNQFGTFCTESRIFRLFRAVLFRFDEDRKRQNHFHNQSDKWSEWRDSNPRPLVPQTSALTGLRYTPTARLIMKGLFRRNASHQLETIAMARISSQARISSRRACKARISSGAKAVPGTPIRELA